MKIETKILISILLIGVALYINKRINTSRSYDKVTEPMTDIVDENERRNTESVQSLESVYNDHEMKIDNLDTDGLRVNGNMRVEGMADIAGRINTDIGADGNICINDLCLNNNNFTEILKKSKPRNFMHNHTHSPRPADHIIYDDINHAFRDGVIAQYGNSSKFTRQTRQAHVSQLDNVPGIIFGDIKETENNGVLIHKPAGFDTIWLRLRGNGVRFLKVRDIIKGQDMYTFSAGQRYLCNYAPDGGNSDVKWDYNVWVPIPVMNRENAKEYGVVQYEASEATEFTVYGVAFSRNPWNHIMNSGYGYSLGQNGGDILRREYWARDNLVSLVKDKVNKLRVPVISNGQDKLLYFIDHAHNWIGIMHAGIKVNGIKVERLRESYDNPFARKFNPVRNMRYTAAKVPANLIPDGDMMLTVEVDLSHSDAEFHIREVGTHDYELDEENIDYDRVEIKKSIGFKYPNIDTYDPSHTYEDSKYDMLHKEPDYIEQMNKPHDINEPHEPVELGALILKEGE